MADISKINNITLANISKVNGIDITDAFTFNGSEISIGPSDPINLTTPTIAGVGYTGQTLVATAGTWSNATSVAGQWYADGVPISGATGTSFNVTYEYNGSAFTYIETAQPNSITATSNEIHNWTPADMTTMLWFDPSNEASLTVISGRISQINDLSGNGYHFNQSTASQRPLYGTRTINGLPVMEYIATNTHVLTRTANPQIAMKTSDTTMTAFVKIDADIITGGNISLFRFQNNNGTRWSVFIRDGFIQGVHNSSYNPVGDNTKSISTGINLIKLYRDNDTLSITTNLDAPVSETQAFGVSNLNTFNLGAYNNRSGDFVQIFDGGWGETVIARTCTVANRERLEGYYHYKWGSAIATGHPYENNAPTV